ncbi:hypothetical protein FQN57_006024 [Myotisia sp. PD_48]|nr:hypothetical protein FQN57_006024 [Myotisia sp. PD_48]
MAVSFTTRFPNYPPEPLPSFRELLPEYLHNQIENAAYDLQTDRQKVSRSASSSNGPTGMIHQNRSSARTGRTSPRLYLRDHRYDDVSLRPDRFSSESTRHTSNQSAASLELFESKRSPAIDDPHILNGSRRSLRGPVESVPSPAGHSPTKMGSTSQMLNPRHHSGATEPSRYQIPVSKNYNSYDTLSSARSISSHVLPSIETVGPSPYSPYQQPNKMERELPCNLYGNLRPHLSLNLSESESGDSREKKRRGNLPKPVTDMLRTWLWEHLDHPYPSEEDKQIFMNRTGLTISQISNWFINARRRQVAVLRNQARVSESERLKRQTSSPHRSEDDLDLINSPSKESDQ